MRFEIDPSPEETQRACAAIVRTLLSPARPNLIVVLAYVAVAVAAAVFTPETVIATSLIGIAGIGGTILALQRETRSRMRRLRQGDLHANEHHFIEVTSDGVRAWCAHVDARYAWGDFCKVTEDKEFYLFVRPSGAGSAVPKRLLGPEEETQLLARLKEWVPSEALALGGHVGGGSRSSHLTRA